MVCLGVGFMECGRVLVAWCVAGASWKHPRPRLHRHVSSAEKQRKPEKRCTPRWKPTSTAQPCSALSGWMVRAVLLPWQRDTGTIVSRPATTNFASQDHQSGPSEWSVRSFLRLAATTATLPGEHHVSLDHRRANINVMSKIKQLQ